MATVNFTNFVNFGRPRRGRMAAVTFIAFVNFVYPPRARSGRGTMRGMVEGQRMRRLAGRVGKAFVRSANAYIAGMMFEARRVAAPPTSLDFAAGFALPGRSARGRLVRLGPLLDEVLAAHNYPAPIARILSEALTLTALLGAMLKEVEGQLTLQAQTEAGIIDLLVCDYRGGELRGYVRFAAERLAELPSLPSLAVLFGRGYLAITFDQAVDGERYQGIVPLEGHSLADAAQSFFSQSEQIPSLVRLAVSDTGHVAGGILLQHLPDGEEGRDRLHTRLDHPEWDHVRILAETIKASELVDAKLPVETLLWRLFHEEEEIRLLPTTALRRGCRCDPAHVRDVIARFPPEERAAMAGEDGVITVDCEFCSRIFPIQLSELG